MTPRVVLVGPPGAGKSTVGRLVAERLSVAFADSDALIEQEAERPVADIFLEEGEGGFRQRERDIVAAALREHDGVLALGGGAVLDDRTRADLVGLPVVLLTADAATAARRVGMNRDRPLLLGNVRGRLAELLREREPLYVEVARWTVGTDDLTPEAAADRVVDLLRGEAA